MKKSPAQKETLLITGGSGLIGQSLAKRLSQEFQIISLDVKEPKRPLPGVTYLNLDVSKEENVQNTLIEIRQRFGRKVASVIHLAAYYSFSGEESPRYEEITVRGTEWLLKSLQDFEVEQFIFSSTMLVHTPVEPGQEVRESTRIGPKWPYPQSKVDAEAIIRKEHGSIPFVLLRIAGVYDDRCHSIPIAHQIERIWEKQLTGHLYPGDLDRGQAFIHLEDLVEALRLAIVKRPELPKDTTLVLGEDEVLSYGELQELIGCEIHGKKWQTFKIPKPVARIGAWVQEKTPGIPEPFIKPWMIALTDDHYDLDITQARRLLGWEPKHRLKDAIPKMISALKQDSEAWYRENKLALPSGAEKFVRKNAPWLYGAAGVLVAGAAAAWIWRSRPSVRRAFSPSGQGRITPTGFEPPEIVRVRHRGSE